ncbi:hypothetical protein KY389_13995 [Paracoccus bogoriensis]|uniref:hypothetical protein n=1 Tax=Paracoccus bogoriensis TaxID=242065 RepID=UPI001CA4D594|nr:hypothetical protein [Paracoccus bogoriensis]MBW7057782.1 hypothetical protein [Paracoccus bogoriensis]
MEQGLEQVMRLVGHRAVEWMCQQVMALPDPLPATHPDLVALAQAAVVGPVIGALSGRRSPIEVLAHRRLHPALPRRAALDHLAGLPASPALILAAPLIAPGDPACALALADLADDPARDVALRLACGASPPPDVEGTLLAPLPLVIDHDCLSGRLTLLLALWRQAGGLPRLSSAARHGDLLAALRDWARLAGQLSDTQCLAQTLCGLLLVDPQQDVAALVTRLLDLQGPDGGFPTRLCRPDGPTPLAQGMTVTLSVLLAFQLTRPNRRIAPLLPPVRPITAAMLAVAARMEDRLQATRLDPWSRLLGDVLVLRATGRNRLSGSSFSPGRARLARLASIVFGDPIAAHALRRHLGWKPDRPLAMPDLAWLAGAPVRLTGQTYAWQEWNRATDRLDERAFMRLVLQARRHGAAPPQRALRFARRLTGAALSRVQDDHASFDDLALALERTILLASAFEQFPAPAMAA